MIKKLPWESFFFFSLISKFFLLSFPNSKMFIGTEIYTESYLLSLIAKP